MENNNTYKSKQVFNYFFEQAKAEGLTLTPMKAIKLVYFAHAWTLAFTDKPLLDEPIQAWKYGAVVPSLYDDLKLYGAGEIKYPIVENQKNYILPLILDKYDQIPKSKHICGDGITQLEKEIISSVWDSYKGMSALQLSNIIHQPGTPWTLTWGNGCCGRNAVIPNDLIKKHYKQKIKDSESNDGKEK